MPPAPSQPPRPDSPGPGACRRPDTPNSPSEASWFTRLSWRSEPQLAGRGELVQKPETAQGTVSPRPASRGTELSPDHFRTGLFTTGVHHKITVVKKGNDLYMHLRNSEKELLCHWRNESFPPIREGRIGLRHLYTRAARYRGFRVWSGQGW